MLANMKSCQTRMPSSSHSSIEAIAFVDHRAADAQHVHAGIAGQAQIVPERFARRRPA